MAKACKWCGQDVTGRRREALFCSPLCRRDYNANRAKKGAQLYDLFMALRYDREAATEAGAWGFMCRMGEEFRQEDIDTRGGRKSWDAPAMVKARNPRLTATRGPRMRIGRGL